MYFIFDKKYQFFRKKIKPELSQILYKHVECMRETIGGATEAGKLQNVEE